MFKCPYEFAGSSCMSGGCLGFLNHQQYGCQVVPRSCKQVKRWNPRWGDGPGGRCRNVEPKPAWTYNITQFVDECWCFFCSWVWKWCSSPEMICICNPDPWVVLILQHKFIKIYIHCVCAHEAASQGAKSRPHPPGFQWRLESKVGWSWGSHVCKKMILPETKSSHMKMVVGRWGLFFCGGEGGCCGCCF